MGLKNRLKQTQPEPKRIIFYDREHSLRVFGCWPMYDKHKNKSEAIYSAFCLISLMNVTSGLFLTFYATVKFAITHGKVDQEVYNDIMLFVILFQILAKMILITSKAPHIRRLSEDLNGYMQNEFVKGEDNKMLINRCYRYDRRLSRFILVFTILLTLSSMTRPLLATTKRYFKQRHLYANATEMPPVIGDLPCKYPFVLHAPSLPYTLCYIQQLAGVVPGAIASWAADSMFCSFLYYLAGHFQILITYIKSDADENTKEIDHNAKIVNHHRFLLSYSMEIQKAFAPIMVLQMLLGSATIGLLMVQLLVIEGDFSLYAKPASYLLLKLLQLYMSCWHGQLLWNKSEEVAEACYSSSWYRKELSTQVNMKMIIARSQKPIKVTAMGIFQFSAHRFAGILNTAYSIFTMMRTMK